MKFNINNIKEKINNENIKKYIDILKTKANTLLSSDVIVDRDTFKIKPFHVVITAALIVTTIGSGIFSKNAVVSAKNSITEDALKTDLIYPGAFFNNYPMGGLTVEQAIERGENDYSKINLATKLDIMSNHTSFCKTYTFYDLGARLDIKTAVNDAYNLARKGSTDTRSEEYTSMLNKRKYINPSYFVDKEKVKECLKKLEPEFKEELDFYDETLDIDATADVIISVMEKRMPGASVPIVTK